jgi:ferredoxin-NADP reductase/DMSO/TMAO reductase YedYZ heme-binding membrane subunit
VWLWWRGTPGFRGAGGWLTGAGEISGLLAGYAVVVLVALMARIPPLERGIGASRLARWHALGGQYAISLVAAHVLLITWGYAVTAHITVTAQAVTLLERYPDILPATAGALLLAGVGIVSARAARRRLRYEAWYYLHLCTYLAVALGFSHQLSNGAEFIGNSAARVAWTAMYAGVAAAVAWFRFITPARQAARHRLRVAAIRWEAPGVVSVLIAGRRLDRLRAEPGQFFRWRFLARGLWWTSTPYSLSAPPGDDVLRITVKAAGDHSRALFGLRKGTRVISEGPYGAMTPAAQISRKVLLIAGGAGITAVRALFEALPGELTLIYRATSPGDIVFREELEQIAGHRGARLWFVTGSRARLAADPLSAAQLRRHIPDLARHDAYVCGPPGMARAVIRELRRAGVRRGRIHHESFEF